jgi:anti-sigma factor RsiW
MSDYLDGDLRPPERVRMERHLSECVECRQLIAGLRLVVDAMHRLPTPGLGPDPVQLAGAVRVRLDEPPAR